MLRPAMTQYTVRLSDREGGISRLSALLGKERVGVRALVAAKLAGSDVVHFLARKDAALRARLERAGLLVREQQIIQLELPNHHWELHKLARALAEQEIGVISLYSAAAGDRLLVILAVDEPANAVALAAKLGFEPEYSVC
ncbi:MAG: hypothetical protein PHF00_00630 [Elusimicrobia bacterium]|nr:hypothetical protein [Elusimicrobiota bacterium]